MNKVSFPLFPASNSGKFTRVAMDNLATMSDAEFARWRASVNENTDAHPAQNPGDLLLEELTPMTNTDDSRETTPSPAPSPGNNEKTPVSDMAAQLFPVAWSNLMDC